MDYIWDLLLGPWWRDEWSADEWSALGSVVSACASVLLAIGTVAAALWAVYIYRRSKRVEAARWLQGMFEQFYLSEHFLVARSLLQYEYSDTVGPLVERRLTNRDVPRTKEEAEIINEVDRFLNYFEWILYLEHNKHLDVEDRLALFNYWFELMKDAERASLRRYCANWDWERLTRELGTQKAEYIAVYGSLMEGLGLEDAPQLTGYLKPVGPCEIDGRLYDLGDYPGLKVGGGTVIGELYQLRFPLSDRRATEAFHLLDQYERYDAHNAKDSLYVRTVVRLKEPAGHDAWVYVYNRPLGDAHLVEGGNWRRHAPQPEV